VFSGIGSASLALFKSPFMLISLPLRFKLVGIAYIREPPGRCLTGASLSRGKNVARHATTTLTKGSREREISESLNLFRNVVWGAEK